MTKRDPGRGQLHKRGARAWRDEENPTGPGQATDEAEVGDGAGLEAPVTEDAEMAKSATDKPVNAGPGGGGATESAGRAKEHEGVHGGPSRKR